MLYNWIQARRIKTGRTSHPRWDKITLDEQLNKIHPFGKLVWDVWLVKRMARLIESDARVGAQLSKSG
jgi:hypothetical protein